MILWNSGFIGAEFGLPLAGPYTLLFYRYLGLTLLLLAYLLIRKRLFWPGRNSVFTAAVVGILAHAVWLGCTHFALWYHVPAGIVALVVALQPLTTGAFSGFAVGEYTPLHRWIGLVLGFIGVALPVAVRVDLSSAASVFGYLIPFGSVIAMTVASLIQRKVEVYHRDLIMPLDLALFYQSLASLIVIIPPAFFAENFAADLNIEFAGIMIWLVIGVSLGAYALMWILISRIDATRVSSLFYLGPPVTMLMAWLAFGDTVQGIDIAGLIIIVAGVAITQLEFRSKKKAG